MDGRVKNRERPRDTRHMSCKTKNERGDDEESQIKKPRRNNNTSDISAPDTGFKTFEPKTETQDGTHLSNTVKQDTPIKLSLLVKPNSNTDFLDHPKGSCVWKVIKHENLNLQSTPLYTEKEANALLAKCEQEIHYNVGDLSKIHIFGKWIDIPRKQVAHGDTGLTYSFSGNTVPARPWTPFLNKICNQITQATGYKFNFVLINRYKDGHDYMGEHKDDEKDLCQGYPIASLSLGQSRDFIFRHQDSRGKNAKKKMDPVSLQLKNGTLLMMNHPTNSYWYHSLPRRTRALGVRVNMTFRKMEPSQCKTVKKME